MPDCWILNCVGFEGLDLILKCFDHTVQALHILAIFAFLDPNIH